MGSMFRRGPGEGGSEGGAGGMKNVEAVEGQGLHGEGAESGEG
jgi:hypothetical protein